MEPGGDITRLLHEMRGGDQGAAEKLLTLVYTELHRLAQACMRRERPDHTLQPTALINEAYLRLAGMISPGKTAPIISDSQPV